MGDTKDPDEKKVAGTGAVVGGVAGGVMGGAAAGGAIGGMTGPVGAAVGAVVGAAAGAIAGKSIAVDPAEEEAYWRDNYTTRPYVVSESTYDDYGLAYRHGVDAYTRYPGRPFDEVESDLGRDWSTSRGSSKLEWERAKHAVGAVWHRVERRLPGDGDNDGI